MAPSTTAGPRHSPHPHRIVVVGGGMAGSRLVQQLAGYRTGAEVTVIGEEPHPPYNRVLLAEVLAGRYAPEVAALPSPASTAGIRTLRGTRAVRIDRTAAEVHCSDGQRVPYDELVLATGANPVLPPLRGPADHGPHGGGTLPAGVHPFRTLDDCLALSAAARPGLPAVVIGGGLLGVSAARALARLGCRVVLAQQGEQLMERLLDAAAARELVRHLEASGVEVHTECWARGLLTGPGNEAPDGSPRRRRDRGGARAVHAVELADGYVLDAQLVVLACGVRPRTRLARDAGLDVRHGIVVDDRLRTSDPRIHAIGDCSEHDGVVHGLAGPAREQADVLAAILAGREPAPRYTGTRLLTRLTLAAHGSRGPFDLAAFGDVRPAPGDEVVRLSDATRGAYRKVVVRDGRLAGGILLGDLSGVGALSRTWERDEPLPADSLLHLFTDHGGPR
ncbi:NAD(P)/FAD-dependent oxidoreductase [Streptomyces meridianus]|uniref:FAD-dependent oxidoreductase n=1 Tax=Streptomyces meridianus TaxID=2938945 RepID=A0ABT0XA55_9ACTN|nr:FAD-dependent oxidoreductase [Streptomyces meridianus]MCM2579397.1 FAD-dependent oxidoreductase [Streptomyces meridianus]